MTNQLADDGAVNELARQPNPGTGLLGPNFARRSRPHPTDETEDLGQWVALDESGWDGDQLYGQQRSRYLSIGTVAISDDEAAPIVEEIRTATRLQAAEVKFSKGFTGPRHSPRRAVLATMLAPGGALHERASVYLVDKHYFIVGKLIDLFIEEKEAKQGRDIRNTDRARQMARSLFAEGPRALGPELFGRLLSTTVAFAAAKNHDQSVTVEDFHNLVEEAWTQSRRRKVTEALAALRTTKEEAAEYLQEAHGPDAALGQSLEPLIPATAAIIANRSKELGRVNFLLDDQRAMTDANLDRIEDEARGRTLPEFRYLSYGVHLGELVRGKSQDHPSLQLADLVSGAGFAVAERYDGQSNPAGDDLYEAVVPLIDPAGLLSHDDPGRIAYPEVRYTR
ncbi:hypothetical protein [Streptomyces cyaneofuscatus]|jgi:hypothetical protein|uniref:hypothetical protein n=1 Tax=Streptomyces cyaneofuscatus TaxID=66883 RepID=UPI00363BE416